MEARQVVGAVHAAAEAVVQQRLYVDGSIPRHGQVKVNAEIVSGNAERRRGEGRRVDALALLVQALPVDFRVIRPRPQAKCRKTAAPRCRCGRSACRRAEAGTADARGAAWPESRPSRRD